MAIPSFFSPHRSRTAIGRAPALALSLALSLAAAASAAEISAEPEAGAREPATSFQLPLSGLLMENAPLRAQVINQIQGTPAASPEAAPASPAAAEIVRGLLSNPDILAAHKAELAGVLGADNVALAAAAAKSGRLQASLGAGLAIDPSDAGAIARVGANLARAFDGGADVARGVDAPAAVASGADSRDARIPASWRLSPNQKVHRSEPGAEAQALQSLAQALRIMDLPMPEERFVENRVDAPVVAWAGLPSIWKLAIFREGGRQDPGNVLYVLDPSWFIQTPGPDGRNQLYMTKGLYFAADGRTPILATYKHPRRVRYFGNWLTLGAFDTDSGVPLETNLDAPMSSSSRLENVTNDKLWTRLLLAGQGARVPATRAFLMPRHVFLSKGAAIPESNRVKVGTLPRNRGEVRRAVVEYLSRFDGPEVVVKPSGARFHSGEGVGFFSRDDVDGITDHVIALSKFEHMDSAGAILLEQRLAPPPIYFRTVDYSGRGEFVYRDKRKYGVQIFDAQDIPSAAPHEKKDYNERVYVVRDRDGNPYTVPLTFFRAGTWGMPTSSQPKNPEDAAAVVDIDLIFRALKTQYGGLMSTPREVEEFLRERADIGQRALRAIIANEKTLARNDGDPYQAQTDMIGLDLMYQLEKGRLVPYIIEVNDHDAAGQHFIDLAHPDQLGEHSRVWVEGMRERARREAAVNP